MATLSSASVGRIAANAATILFGIVIILQLLIAAGVFPITMAWGGRQHTLTVALRFASLASVVVLTLLAYAIRRRVGLVGGFPIPIAIKVLSWATTAFMALNTVTNLGSASKAEKAIFTPITFLLMLSCFLVSISRPES
jgi:hypothetical protein